MVWFILNCWLTSSTWSGFLVVVKCKYDESNDDDDEQDDGNHKASEFSV